jgi:hypothetical protein
MGETRTGKSKLWFLWGAICLALSGCTPTPVPTPSATIATVPTPTLSDAVAAFARFNSVLDGYIGGTASVDAFKPLVTPEYFDRLVIEDAGVDDETRTVGPSSFAEEKLVDPEDWGGVGDLALVVCVDISRTRVVDSKGLEVRDASRKLMIPMIIFFDLSGHNESELLVTEVDQWNEDGYCSS